MPDAPEVQSNGDGVADTTVQQNSKPPALDLNAPELQAAIQAATEAATKDLRSKLNEFRDSNVTLMKSLDAYKASGLQPDDVKKIADNIKKNKEVELAAKGQYEELVAMRIEPVKRDYEERLRVANDSLEELSQKYRTAEQENFDLIIGSKVGAAVAQHKDVFPEAGELIKELARKVWRKDENGNIRPFRANGTPWISKDQTDISFYDWINELRDTYPFFFAVKPGLTARGGPATQSNIDAINAIQNPMARLEEARKAGIVKPIFTQT